MTDLVLAGKTLRGKGKWWIILAFTLSFVCLFSGGRKWFVLYQMKQMPCEVLWIPDEAENAFGRAQRLGNTRALLEKEPQVQDVSEYVEREGVIEDNGEFRLIVRLRHASALENLACLAEQNGFYIQNLRMLEDNYVNRQPREGIEGNTLEDTVKDWESRGEESRRQLLLGVFMLGVSGVVFYYYEALWREKEKRACRALRLMGWGTTYVRKIEWLRGCLLLLTGMLGGILIILVKG